uniref:C-type lectin domain-containing protein n=1 Tax=Mastacembelus armatus TaxID=205130 RepID=A0A7N8Y9T9_9TELE
ISVRCDLVLLAVLLSSTAALYANANGKSYVVVNSLLRWPDAQTYCRKFHTDLALVENAEDNAALPVIHVTKFAWIGLYRMPWSWSDKSIVTFTNFDVGQPDNQGGEHCVVDNPDHFWHDASCSISSTV